MTRKTTKRDRMTYRQYLIGQALSGAAWITTYNPEAVAQRAIEMADAVLERFDQPITWTTAKQAEAGRWLRSEMAKGRKP